MTTVSQGNLLWDMACHHILHQIYHQVIITTIIMALQAQSVQVRVAIITAMTNPEVNGFDKNE